MGTDPEDGEKTGRRRDRVRGREGEGQAEGGRKRENSDEIGREKT